MTLEPTILSCSGQTLINTEKISLSWACSGIKSSAVRVQKITMFVCGIEPFVAEIENCQNWKSRLPSCRYPKSIRPFSSGTNNLDNNAQVRKFILHKNFIDYLATWHNNLDCTNTFLKRCLGRGANLGSFWFSYIFCHKMQRLRPLGYYAPLLH